MAKRLSSESVNKYDGHEEDVDHYGSWTSTMHANANDACIWANLLHPSSAANYTQLGQKGYASWPAHSLAQVQMKTYSEELVSAFQLPDLERMRMIPVDRRFLELCHEE
ncbi:hypothetical protein SAY87_015633 [Trapa incisa]|uniref:Uncharacterized protein n=1 Tax=Trapa incisa TaxID=236973 RepID=A0AAN7LFG0_9MYRT|nr:hypothetical protein SAY87_015633 [Trapa incisa]